MGVNKSKKKITKKSKFEFKSQEEEEEEEEEEVWFYSISTIVGYLMSNPFLYI